MFYFVDKENLLNILIKVKINAKNTKINKVVNVETIYSIKKALQIDLKSSPIDGKANKELIKFLSNTLSTNKSNFEIISGKKAKLKLIKVKNLETKNLKSLNT
jgi:uncharacterized protein